MRACRLCHNKHRKESGKEADTLKKVIHFISYEESAISSQPETLVTGSTAQLPHGTESRQLTAESQFELDEQLVSDWKELVRDLL